MILDWEALNRWDIIFGIIGGIALFGSWIVWGLRKTRAKSIQEPIIKFEIKEQYAGLDRGGITYIRQEIKLEEEFTVELLTRTFISNPGSSTSVAFFVASIEPDCLQDGILAKGLKIIVQHQTDHRHSPIPYDNPFYLKSEEMSSSIQVRVKIPFNVSRIENKFGSLSSMQKIKVTFGAEQTGRKPIFQSAIYDLSEIHQRIEEEAATKVQHLESQQLSAKQMLQVLKRYWHGPQ